MEKAKKISKIASANKAMMAGATYTNKAVIRDGNKVYIKKRMNGKFRLTRKQKTAFKKGSKKNWTATMKAKLSNQ